MSEFYGFSANSLRGEPISLEKYKGKVVLVVNVASKCGLTPQYEGLEALHQKFGEQGLVILGFPCNQFGGQEPGGVAEIEQTCRINYGVTFQMFEKIEVNGNGAHPLYQYLKKAQPGLLGNGIKWNFTKFLIGADGNPLKRFAPTTKPKDLERDIKKALEQAA